MCIIKERERKKSETWVECRAKGDSPNEEERIKGKVQPSEDIYKYREKLRPERKWGGTHRKEVG